ncbi:MAG TPA: hypothetical protein VK658_06760 [Chryseolinea sp.]|nr:hypothetical protein [Chryseolinea sp.]
MKTPTNKDNIFKTGTTIYARVNPTEKLFIIDYKARVYYCNTVGVNGGVIRAYFERELIPDVQRLSSIQNAS